MCKSDKNLFLFESFTPKPKLCKTSLCSVQFSVHCSVQCTVQCIVHCSVQSTVQCSVQCTVQYLFYFSAVSSTVVADVYIVTDTLSSANNITGGCTGIVHYTTLHCTELHCCVTQWYTIINCTALYYTALHCNAVHYTTRHYNTIKYTTIH